MQNLARKPESEEQSLLRKLKREQEIDRVKEEAIQLEVKYWDGFEIKKNLTVKKGIKIGTF